MVISERIDVKEGKWPEFFNSLPTSKKRKEVIKGPSYHEILEEYYYEHDTEDHLESFYHEYIEDNYPSDKYVLI